MNMKKIPTKEEALLSMAGLCARSEQCAFDIRRNLRLKGMSASDTDEIVDYLMENRYIDDSRFARSFSRDKVRFSAWGRMNIRMSLLAKRIPAAIIDRAFEEIDENDYSEALRRTAASAVRRLDLKVYEDRLKLYKYLLSRGFESSYATAEVKRLTVK